MSSKWKGIPEGQKGKGHEGHCAQTRISPNSIKKWSDVTSPLILNDNNICLIAFLAALAALYEADADFPESGVW